MNPFLSSFKKFLTCFIIKQVSKDNTGNDLIRLVASLLNKDTNEVLFLCRDTPATPTSELVKILPHFVINSKELYSQMIV